MDNKKIEIIYVDESNKIYQKFYDYIENINIDNFLKLHNILYKDFTIGVFGKIKESNYQLAPGDRIEFYRKLYQDPKIRRKKLAK